MKRCRCGYECRTEVELDDHIAYVTCVAGEKSEAHREARNSK